MTCNQKRYRENYQRLKADHICTRCRKNPSNNGVYCEECKRYYKDVYNWRKESGICVACGKEQAQKGYTRCLLCRMDTREKSYEHEKQKLSKGDGVYRRKKYKDNADRYKRYKEEHKCTRCGKQMPEYDKHVACALCRKKKAKAAEEKRRSKGVLSQSLRGDGVWCLHCTKPVEHKGDKLCEKCRVNACQALEKARANIKANRFKKYNDQFWRSIKKPETKTTEV